MDIPQAYLKLMEHVTQEGYITQQYYLNLFPEDMDKTQLLADLDELERQGVFKSGKKDDEVVYYLADVVHH